VSKRYAMVLLLLASCADASEIVKPIDPPAATPTYSHVSETDGASGPLCSGDLTPQSLGHPAIWCPDPFPYADGLFAAWSWGQCVGGEGMSLWDLDNDGIDDRCEHAVAMTMRPQFVLDHAGCNWDEDLYRLGGEYLIAVKPNGFGRLRIAYLMAYAHGSHRVTSVAG
jgi:hypothetical protein